MVKDYYKILEISENSTIEDIKHAYRNLARKWHPDVAGNSLEAIEMFKNINEAYQTLSNSVKKEDYDKARKFYNYSKNKSFDQKNTYKQTTKPNNEYKNTNNKDNKKEKNFFSGWEDFILNKNREKNYKKSSSQPKRGEDIITDIEISIFDVLNGTTKTINMLQTQICPACKGHNFINGASCHVCNGSGKISNYKKFSVKIPAGTKDGSKIRLAGEGEAGINGGINGDLYLLIHLIEPKNYKTEGLNILKTINISPSEAILGADIKIPTIQGLINLKINPYTQNGQKIRLKQCGIEQNNQVGDMIVTVEIQIPKKLTQEELELYKKLQEISSSSVREY